MSFSDVPEGGLLVGAQQCCVQKHVQVKTSQPSDADLLLQRFIFPPDGISLVYLYVLQAGDSIQELLSAV